MTSAEGQAAPQDRADVVSDIPIVAIGASAGGLDAFKKFFSHMPPKSGIAFVLIQHLDPNHESLMVELLTRQTSMQVQQAQNEMKVEANNVYIIPPDKYMSISKGVLHLLKPVERRGMRMPIDYFFRALAEDRQEKAICIIMSGTGSDGTLGMRAIKEFGGMAMVQDPLEAAYDGMPRSGINTGMVDYVTKVEQMPEDLVRYVGHSYMKTSAEGRELTEGPVDNLNQVLALLRTRTNYDFRYYKKNTLVRRIERRMGLSNTEDMADYLNYLRETPDELKLMFKDLLISVTRFFRDTEAMETLQKEIIPEIVHKLEEDQPIRVWIPGCATGEEAYSIAMMLIEECAEANIAPNIQIFATDIDEDALEFARAGVYLDTIVADLSPERLKRFFSKENHSYKVNKQLRETVVFAVQNLITDPPFSKLDLITCRNLLIYLETDTQRKIMQLFHLALKNTGYLFLGPSETIGRAGDMFQQISKQYRIYQRIGPSRRVNIEFPVGAASFETKPVLPRVGGRGKREPTIEEVTQKILLEKFAPASVMVNQDNVVEYFFGETEHYLSQPSGEPTRDLFRLSRHGLRTKLRATLYKARQDGKIVESEDIKVLFDGSFRSVKVTVTPVDTSTGENMLVSFHDQPLDEGGHEVEKDSVVNEDTALRQLEYELHATREELQSTIEEMETSNEELKASNEEVMSMNEELQSTNEELETSKEELQSLNEELTTVNNELQDKVAELESTNNDFSNLLSSTEVATIFLDVNLKIKRFTPSVTKLLNLIPTDVNRPISDVSRQVDDPELLEDVQKVLDKLTPIEIEVQGPDDSWYIRRILPYRTQENKIEGVVITYTDISIVKEAQTRLTASQKNLAEAQRLAHIGSWDWDIVNDRLEWSDEVYRIFGTSRKFFKGSYPEFISFVHPEDRKFVEDCIEQSLLYKKGYDIDHRVLLRNGQEKVVHENAQVTYDEQGNAIRMIGTVQDVTRRKQDENELKALNENLELRVAERTQELKESEMLIRSVIDNASMEILLKDLDSRFIMVNKKFLQCHRMDEKEVVGKTLEDIYDEGIYKTFREIEQKVLDTGRSQHTELVGPEIGYGAHELLITKFPVRDMDGKIIAIGAINADISEQKEAMRNQQVARLEADMANEAKSQFLASMSHELRTPLNAIMGYSQLLQMDEDLKADSHQEAVTRILDASRHLLQLITQILDLSRIESGNLALEIEDIRVADFLKDAVNITSVMADKHKVKLNNRCQLKDVWLRGDRDRARQVLINLLSNAIKYNHEGGIVDINCFIKENNMFRISITDTGCGIPEEMKQKVFEPFNRLGGHPYLIEGTGIGLSISKELIELMDGDIGFDSEVNKGSVFWVDFPISERTEKDSDLVNASQANLKLAGKNKPVPADTDILYIEDNYNNRVVMEALIKKVLGLNIRTANDAEQGLKMCQESLPDLVLMDIHLPGMDGVDAIRLLKDRAETRNVPVIAVSADAMDDNIDVVLKAGAAEYITKPFDIEKIISSIIKLAGKQP